jgi:hypothetical protein
VGAGSGPPLTCGTAPPLSKRCAKCQAEKASEQFRKANAAKDGLSSYCKECHAAYNRGWRETHRADHNASNLAWWHKRTVEQQMLAAARSRAAQKGLPFALTLDDIVIPERCPALGIPLFKEGGRAHDGSPSLDRLVPSEGYVPGNVRVISNRANSIKRDATAAELLAVAEYVKRQLSPGSP